MDAVFGGGGFDDRRLQSRRLYPAQNYRRSVNLSAAFAFADHFGDSRRGFARHARLLGFNRIYS